jgi:hypothetical protein
MKRIILFVMAFSAVILTSSCTKYDGGNADMQTVDFVVYETDWNVTGAFGNRDYGYYVDLDFPEITPNVVLNGMVSLYIKSGDSWVPAPAYSYLGGYEGGFVYALRQGVFSIDYYESDFQTDRPATQYFRLVIVQPV